MSQQRVGVGGRTSTAVDGAVHRLRIGEVGGGLTYVHRSLSVNTPHQHTACMAWQKIRKCYETERLSITPLERVTEQQ